MERGRKAYVSDEQGFTQKFIREFGGVNWVHTREEKIDAKTQGNTLQLQGNEFVFTKKFGTTCVYERSSLVQRIAPNRWDNEGTPIQYDYYRLREVTDRQGNRLEYFYPEPYSLIPHLIADPARPGHRLSIQQEQGRIIAVRDPVGNTTHYTYDLKGALGNVPVLKSVSRPDGSTVSYQYDIAYEPDPNPPEAGDDRAPIEHVTVGGITDPEGAQWSFGYEFNHKFSYLETDDQGNEVTKIQTGLPRLVTTIFYPDGMTTLDGERKIHVLALDDVAATSAETTATGPAGHTYSYLWSDPEIFIPNEDDDAGHEDGLSLHLTVSYKQMLITPPAPYDDLSEIYLFDPDHAMALSWASDLCHNSTTFGYGGDGFDDPTAEINAIGQVRLFTYDATTRVLDSMKDFRGVQTTYSLKGTTGLRSSEVVTFSEGSSRQALFEYNDPDFPGFMTRKIVKSNGTPGLGDLITEYEPDDNGRVRIIRQLGGPEPIVSEVWYDDAGNKRFEVDPRGNVTEFQYDERNRIKKMIHPDGSQRSWSYDSRGNLISETDEVGHTTTHSWDALSRKVETRLVDIATQWTYNWRHQHETITDSRGLVTFNEYDELGRVFRTTAGYDEENGPTGWEQVSDLSYAGPNWGGTVFDTDGFRPTRTVQQQVTGNVVTDLSYDSIYRPLSSTVTGLGSTVTDYDPLGAYTRVTDPLGRATKTYRDAFGNVTRVIYADGSTEEFHYTQHDQVWQSKDRAGNRTDTSFDGVGRAVEVKLPAALAGEDRATTVSVYDAAGNAIEVTDALGNVTEIAYDTRNRAWKTTAPPIDDPESGEEVRPVSYALSDGVGRLVQEVDPLLNTTFHAYDHADRKTGTTDPLGHTITWSYEPGGQVLITTDQRGMITENAYDEVGFGRLVSTTDPMLVTTEFDWDQAGNRKVVRDGKGNETTFSYDPYGRVESRTFANGDGISNTWDAVGRQLSKSDGAGTTTFTYHPHNDWLEVTDPPGPSNTRTLTHDAMGRVKTASELGNPEGDVTYGYDNLGRVIAETSRGVSHTYTYDLAGNRIGASYGTGASETREYNALGAITKLTDNQGRETHWFYDLAGRAITLILPNNQQQDNEYDAASRLVERTLYAPSGGGGTGALAHFTWGHDPAGNVTLQTESWPGETARAQGVRTVEMTYFDANYLETETVNAPGEPVKVTTYTYDDAYNRDSKTVMKNGALSEAYTYTFNEANQLTGWSGGGEVAVLTYDGRGNRATETINGGTPKIYDWDYQNRLSSVVMPNGDAYAYQYDYRTRRIGRDEPNGVTTGLTYSGGLSLAEYPISDLPSAISAPQAPTVEYRRGPDMGGGIGGMLYSLRGGVEKYSLSNGRGDIVAQSDAGGSLTWTASYEAFGMREDETGVNADRQRANTKEEDPTGLLYEHFRYRDLKSGVWLSRDPAGFVDGPNLYAYVRQNPWSAFDPLGLDTNLIGPIHPSGNEAQQVNIKRAQEMNDRFDIDGHSGQEGFVKWEEVPKQYNIRQTEDGNYVDSSGKDRTELVNSLDATAKDQLERNLGLFEEAPVVNPEYQKTKEMLQQEFGQEAVEDFEKHEGYYRDISDKELAEIIMRDPEFQNGLKQGFDWNGCNCDGPAERIQQIISNKIKKPLKGSAATGFFSWERKRHGTGWERTVWKDSTKGLSENNLFIFR